jgi:hypothetical protein
VGCGTNQAYAIHPNYHPGTDLIEYSDIVKQRVTDSNIKSLRPLQPTRDTLTQQKQRSRTE